MRVGCQKLSAMYVEFTFDSIPKNLAFAPKKIFVSCYLFVAVICFRKQFFVLKIPLMAKICCETRYQKGTLNYGCCRNGRESDKTSTIMYAVTTMMSLILYKCFRTNDKDIFQLTNAFSRLISLTFLYCCSTTSVD